jgi:hypothetical protein
MAKANQRAPLPPPATNSSPAMLDDPTAGPVRSAAPPAAESNTTAPPPKETDQPPVREGSDSPAASNGPPLTAGVDITREGVNAVINKPPVSQETTTPARRGDEGRPYCPKHQCYMQSTGTRGNVTHYGCPVPTCRETEKLVKPTVSMAREPWECPCQSCRKPQQYLEFDDKLSTPAIAHMVCPQCKFSMKTPRSQVADLMQLKRLRPAREKFGGR